MYSIEMIPGSQLETVASRLFAKRFAGSNPTDAMTTVRHHGLTPQSLKYGMQQYAYRVLDESVGHLLDSGNSALTRGFPATTEAIYDDLTSHLSAFVSSSVEDSIAVTLTIPKMNRADALNIALSSNSKRAIRHFAMHRGNETLELPDDEQFLAGEYKGSEILRYNPVNDHIDTTMPPSEAGCPVARGKGELIEQFYAFVATITLTEVEMPKGAKYYYPV